MILGSFVEEYDDAEDYYDDDDNNTIGPTSPYYSRSEFQGVFDSIPAVNSPPTMTPNPNHFALPSRTATGKETMQQTSPSEHHNMRLGHGTPNARPPERKQRKSGFF